MSFFGITQLGYQNTIREYIKNPTDHSKTYLPPIEGAAPKPQPSVLPIDQFSGYGPGPEGSYKEMVRLQTKHIRPPSGPLDIYRRPVSTGMETGQFIEHEPLREKLPWSYVKRHVHVNSEMTRFVNEMALTNREFSLF